MTTGDVICPVCSAVNRSLNLEETDGWMECISCGAVVQVIHLEENYHSVYAPDQGLYGNDCLQQRVGIRRSVCR